MARKNHHSDVLIIGAGSAGCVLANRLSVDPHRTVTLVEAGGSDRHPIIRIPSAFYLPVRHRRFNWGYTQRAGTSSQPSTPALPSWPPAGWLLVDKRDGLRARESRRFRPVAADGR